MFKSGHIRIIGDFNTLCMSWMVSVCWMFIFSTNITNFRVDDSWADSKQVFHSPKTATSYICFFICAHCLYVN